MADALQASRFRTLQDRVDELEHQQGQLIIAVAIIALGLAALATIMWLL